MYRSFSNHYPQITISGDAAGMNILIAFHHEKSEQGLQQIARQNSINILPLSTYYNRATLFKKDIFIRFAFTTS